MNTKQIMELVNSISVLVVLVNHHHTTERKLARCSFAYLAASSFFTIWAVFSLALMHKGFFLLISASYVSEKKQIIRSTGRRLAVQTDRASGETPVSRHVQLYWYRQYIVASDGGNPLAVAHTVYIGAHCELSTILYKKSGHGKEFLSKKLLLIAT